MKATIHAHVYYVYTCRSLCNACAGCTCTCTVLAVPCVSIVAHVRELEEEVQELLSKIRGLERTNSALHNKVLPLCVHVPLYMHVCVHLTESSDPGTGNIIEAAV